ncbi:cell division protein SepF [Tomitella biformata]|uniref:cell division protein SepF n=1 Tax=Tomitella biformata TaxID=630403 RepID=UPI000466F573|nr:cell division protein SepF [Tomitella biformata]
MSSLQKFKAYFGMVPLDDFEDDYLDDADPVRGKGENYDNGYRAGTYRASAHDEYEDERYAGPRYAAESHMDASPARGGRVSPMTSTRGSLAVDPRMEARAESRLNPRHGGSLFDEAGGMSKITTLRPRDYSEARTIGEQFRDGVPVIMDLVEMSNADAKRLVDFAAGLAFALRGSFDKVATKVFLLSPADVDVSAEDRRRIAETGFYSK